MAFIRVVEPRDADEKLLAIYQAMNTRPMPAVYRAPHGGPAGIVRAHSADPELLVTTFSATGARMVGTLSWAEMELISAAASQTNGCFY